ncbi:MAG: sigma-70 family RNA polymerase sigma factor [Pseudomonadota bacterium]
MQAQRGDEAAYRALLDELARAIRGYLLGRFGPLDSLDDCVQESLLALHEARHSYDGRRPFKPWLFAIVRNRTIDQLRRSTRHETGREALEDVQPLSEDVAAPIDTGRLLGSLSKTLRDTLILTKIMGYSTRECADRQGISESVVKVRVHRGLNKLRSLCEGEKAIELLSEKETG